MAQPNAPKNEVGAIAPLGYAPSALTGQRGWQGFMDDLTEHVPELKWPERNTWYERMLYTDGKIESSYLGLTMPLWDYVWALEPNGADIAALERFAADTGLPIGMPSPDDDESYELLPGAQGFQFLGHLQEALLAPAFGHYPFEMAGESDKADDLWWRLRELSPRAPATLAEILVDPSGNLIGIRQDFSRPKVQAGNSLVGASPELIPAERLAYYTWRADGRVRWTGRPMMRSLYRHWVVKDVLIRVDAINHERAGGVPVIETDETWSGNSLAELHQAAAGFRVGEDSGAALPPGAKMVLKALGGTDTIASITYHDEQMAQQWTDQVAALGSSEAGGNRALGQTQAGRQALARRAIARWFAAQFREQAIKRWWSYNLPEGSPYPVLAFRPRREVAGAVTTPAAPAAPPQEAPPPNPPQAAVPPVPSQPASTEGSEGVAAEREAGRDRRGGVGHVRGDRGADREASGASSVAAEAVGSEDSGGRGVGTSVTANPAAPVRPIPSSSYGGMRRGTDPLAPSNLGGAASDERPPTESLRASFTLPERPVRRQPYEHEIRAAVDFATIETQHENSTAKAHRLFETEWMPALSQQVRERIEELGDDPTPAALAAIAVDRPDPEPLEAILYETAKRSADEAGAELAAQSLTVREAQDATLRALIAGQAAAMAQQVADGVRLAATRRAIQLSNPAVPVNAANLASETVAYLDGLEHAWERRQLAGAVQQAQTAGRFARFEEIEQAASYYISALLDGATCEPCATDDGAEFASLEEIMAYMSSGANPNCEGGPNCRCTAVAVAGEV